MAKNKAKIVPVKVKPHVSNGAASRNKHDLCDMANCLNKDATAIAGVGIGSLEATAVELRKFATRMKQIAQLV